MSGPLSWLLDDWRQIGQSLSRHRLRTLLTAFGVFWGVFMVVLLLGIGKGMERGVYNLFRDDAFNSVWISAERMSVPFAGFSAGRRIQLDETDVIALRDAIPGFDERARVINILVTRDGWPPQRAVAGFFRQFAHFLADLEDAFFVGIFNHRHH